ncbi:putative bifunctional diguanylate cyclase/phosphodiesterase [Thalassolituus sp.]|jgi:diguanylate cyclase (GGDEF)-like protein/PAS domain S-box-containing protein|uniref:putative bifunctional diguanylate cyclase/phosphodiesterase n=1 Tax=Thalassolituus sp. TaxID=2030822 RepID=UPI002A8212EF|nr:EAL domain-containing protein [Thalassolituus sp.]|tara:strand:- start:190 stop:2862 length:2673 start_codon:yes stop_codon:yes gene_type:complete
MTAVKPVLDSPSISEGWSRIEREAEEGISLGVVRSASGEIRLETILERCLRVFLTTRTETLRADIEGALLHIARYLKARSALVFVADNGNSVSELLVSIGAKSVEELPHLLNNYWRNDLNTERHYELGGSKVLRRAAAIPADLELLNVLDSDNAILLPVSGQEGAVGFLLISFEQNQPPLSNRRQALLATFAQLCFLVQDRLTMMSQLEEREQLLRQTERLANIGSWQDDVINDVINITPQAAIIFEQEETLTTVSLSRFFEYVHPDDSERVAKTLTESMQQHKPSDMVYRIVTESGAIKVIHGRADVIVDDDDKLIGRVGSIQDITEQQAKEHRLRQAMTVFESTMEGVVITDARNRVEAINPAFTSITGFEEADVLGQSISLLSSGRHSRAFYDGIARAIQDRSYWRGEIWNRRKNGQVYPQWLTITEVKDAQNRITNYVGVFSDMSRIKESEEQLEHLSNYDSLTNLPNRALLLSRLEGAVNVATQKGRKVGVIAIDLDHFKHINDSLGHPAGDRLLQEFAQRMRQRLRDSDTVARQGGDDFVVVLENVISHEQVSNVADIILNLLRTPFDVGVGQELYIGASLGITLFPDHGSDVTQLLSNADVAMYQAKQRGRNNYQFYSNDMTQAVSDRLELGNQLRGALQHDNELQLYYQPQVCLIDGHIVGVEALMRWHHPQEGIIAPGRFLPVAEDNGLMPELDSWALRVACHQIAFWQSEDFEPMVVAVNISQPTFVAGGLVERLRRLLDDTKIDPSWLELEITEGALLEPSTQVLDTINGLKELGVMLAVDDFGTGYSSLAYLHRYRVDKLKIDRSFVQSVEDEDEGRVITTTIIHMAKGLGLQVLAEGVETEAQLNFLRDNGCESYQGFYFSKPVPVTELKLEKTKGH